MKVLWAVTEWFNTFSQNITWLFNLREFNTYDRLRGGSLRINMPALWDPIILTSIILLVRPLRSHDN